MRSREDAALDALRVALRDVQAQDREIEAVLLRDGLIAPEQVDDAERSKAKWGVSLGDALMALGSVRAQDFARAQAVSLRRPFADLIATPPDESLFDRSLVDEYSTSLHLPIARDGHRIIVALGAPTAALVDRLHERHAGAVEFVITSKYDIQWTIQRVFESEFTHRALHGLYESHPRMSARTVFTASQLAGLYGIGCLMLLGLLTMPVATLVGVNVLMSLFFIGNFVLKATLAWRGAGAPHPAATISDEEVAAMNDVDLPIYTILLPAYNEPEVMPILTASLRALDYPRAKLDIKLVLEAGDTVTIDAVKALALESQFEIIRVPPSHPRTKPKACNYALPFARGEFVAIYDAEDRPEPDQLKKVVATFRKAPPNTVVIQCRLNYFNATENWLTRMFTMDYSLWFDLLLTGLEAMKVPIPLGGSSNHFRASVLRELHAWDPYNVTEDCDLGVRISQKGYRVGTVNSTTFEEAVVSIPVWISQRSRWIKGYMQTYLVHMREPIVLYRTLGRTAFWCFQFSIGGTIVAGLSNPVFWLMYGWWLVTRSSGLDPLFPGALLFVSLFNLIIGNGFFIFLMLLGPLKRRNYTLLPYGLTVIAYWTLLSAASYKALWQLITRPFHWEKTQHGMTRIRIADLRKVFAGTSA